MLCKVIEFSSAKTPKDLQLDALEEQIKLLGYRPRLIVNPKTEAEKKENSSGIFIKGVNSGGITLKDYQRQRYEKMLDGVPEYREWVTNNSLDALEEQIKLLGYRPRHIEYPKTEAERKENASGIFMNDVNSGNTKLKDYQRQRYEKMLDGVPEYREWKTNNNLDALEEQIKLLGYRPRHIEYPKTEAERKENASGIFMNDVNSGNTKLKGYQRQRYAKMLDGVPEYREWETNNHLDDLEKQIKLLGYRPRQVQNPKTEAEKKENASSVFIHGVDSGGITLKDYQRQRYEQMLDGVPEYREWETNNHLDDLEKQIKLLGYRPRLIHSPNNSEAEAEKKENASGIFMNDVNRGNVTLKDYQRQRYEKILDGVSEYQEYINEKNLCKLEAFILVHKYKPSTSVWASEEEKHLAGFYYSVKNNQVNLSASQQKRFDAIKDAPTMRQYYKKHGLTWR
ncbi:MAG: hypothetical protein LBQ83_04825 [Candidatus Margulisbacteria bacterium]|jgi:dsDNA-binding SOS-regulon protein|nr:hypothetical protein [Candidatus Margulisiibacteriota bacterium]